MVLNHRGDRLNGLILENGCGVGMYALRLAAYADKVVGLEYDYQRASEAYKNCRDLKNISVMSAAGEDLPFPDGKFDMILSHEVLEHVQNDRQAVIEMVRTLRSGGVVVIFAPNRGYPFETHGFFWRSRYHFGNIPLINYLPRYLRNRLAPHVRVYTTADLRKLFEGLPVRIKTHTVIFGAYDNIIEKTPVLGRGLRFLLQALEKTPFRFLGLSHFWVVEKVEP